MSPRLRWFKHNQRPARDTPPASEDRRPGPVPGVWIFQCWTCGHRWTGPLVWNNAKCAICGETVRVSCVRQATPGTASQPGADPTPATTTTPPGPVPGSVETPKEEAH